jgi:hypothetical protein
MSTVGETKFSEVKYLYDIALGTFLNLPSLSIGYSALFNTNLTRSQKLPLIAMIIASCGATIYGKKTIPVTLILNIVTIVYYRSIVSKESTKHEYLNVYLNTLLTMSILFTILYTAQLCLRG